MLTCMNWLFKIIQYFIKNYHFLIIFQGIYAKSENL